MSIANSISFHYRPNSENIKAQVFQSIQENSISDPFWPFLRIFFSLKKLASVMHNFISICITMPKIRKNRWSNSKNKYPERCTEGWTAFFNYYLAAPRPTLCHSQRDSLTNLMLITVFIYFNLKVNCKNRQTKGNLHNWLHLVAQKIVSINFNLIWFY